MVICVPLAENGSPKFESFLNLLGERVRLKDFPNYRGGLDNRSELGCGCVRACVRACVRVCTLSSCSYNTMSMCPHGICLSVTMVTIVCVLYVRM